MHGARGQSLLVRLGRIFFGFLDRVPTEDRHELMGGRAIVRCDRRARLAQSVRRAVAKFGLITSVPAGPGTQESGGIWRDARASNPVVE